MSNIQLIGSSFLPKNCCFPFPWSVTINICFWKPAFLVTVSQKVLPWTSLSGPTANDSDSAGLDQAWMPAFLTNSMR